jgi:transposase-like protein
MELNKRRLSRDQQFSILKEHFDIGTPISTLARVHNISPVTIYQWKRRMSEQPKEQVNLEELLKELQELRKDKDRLTKALGEASLDNQCLKEINRILKKKSQEHLLKQPKRLSRR